MAYKGEVIERHGTGGSIECDDRRKVYFRCLDLQDGVVLVEGKRVVFDLEGRVAVNVRAEVHRGEVTFWKKEGWGRIESYANDDSFGELYCHRTFLHRPSARPRRGHVVTFEVERNAGGGTGDWKAVNVNVHVHQIHNMKLVLGDANFTGTVALISIMGIDPTQLIATNLNKCTERGVKERIRQLEMMGVEVHNGGIDARRIHERFPTCVFDEIFWICPHDGSNTRAPERTLPKLLQQFFQSAAMAQQDGCRVHLALLNRQNNYDQCQTYGLVRAVLDAGYGLCDIRPNFYSELAMREYTHSMTLLKGRRLPDKSLRHIELFTFVKGQSEPAVGGFKLRQQDINKLVNCFDTYYFR